MMSGWKTAAPLALACGAALAAPGAGTASASYLYFEKVPVKSASEATCLRFAHDVGRNQGLAKLKRTNAEVAGEKDGAYIAITCVGRGQQPAIGIVMSMAPSFETARNVGRHIAGRLKLITCIDDPC